MTGSAACKGLVLATKRGENASHLLPNFVAVTRDCEETAWHLAGSFGNVRGA